MWNVTLRYWYQDEGLGTSLVLSTNYVSIGYSNTGKVVAHKAFAALAGADADHYLQLSFSGTLAAQGDKSTNDPPNYQGAVDVTNDYSYNAGATGYNDRITLHEKGGRVIWGTPPGLPVGQTPRK
jgi:hypothetical protein